MYSNHTQGFCPIKGWCQKSEIKYCETNTRKITQNIISAQIISERTKYSIVMKRDIIYSLYSASVYTGVKLDSEIQNGYSFLILYVAISEIALEQN